MKTKLALLFLIVAAIQINAQTGPQVTITDLREDNGKIDVFYTITGLMPEQYFDIQLVAKKQNGQELNVKTVSGDVGQKIKGGGEKKIVWEYQKDGIYLDEDVSIEIKADLKTDINYYSMQQLLIASTLMPGKGVNLLDRSKPYVPWTVAGYGFTAGAFLFYSQAKKNYANYNDALTTADRDLYYGKVKTQKTLINVFTLSAISVWGINYYRVYATKKRLQNSLTGSYWYFSPGYDYVSNSPMFTFYVKF